MTELVEVERIAKEIEEVSAPNAMSGAKVADDNTVPPSPKRGWAHPSEAAKIELFRIQKMTEEEMREIVLCQSTQRPEEQPKSYCKRDYYLMFLFLLLFPAAVVVLVAGIVIWIIPYFMFRYYAKFQLTNLWFTRLNDDQPVVVPRVWHFYVFCVVVGIFIIPYIIFALIWAFIVWFFINLMCLPIGLFNWQRTKASLRAVGSFWGRPGFVPHPNYKDFISYSPVQDFAKKFHSGFGIFTFTAYVDLIVAFISVSRKHRWQLTISFPATLALCPLEKFGTNCPFLYWLEPTFLNQWTLPIDVDQDGAHQQYELDQTVAKMNTLLYDAMVEPVLNRYVDNMPFFGFYQWPPPGRESNTVIGMQMGAHGWINQFFAVVICGMPEVAAVHKGLKKPEGERDVEVYMPFLECYIMAWNPWHRMTGVVEVNLLKDGRMEHPMWIVADPSSRLSMALLVSDINYLFVKVGVWIALMAQQLSLDENIPSQLRDSVWNSTSNLFRAPWG